ncbi:MAG: hypothetical protein ABIT09_09995 [Croceibacterium sp.]
MSIAKARQAPPNADADTGQVPLLWLLGQPHLRDYLAFFETKVCGGEQADPRALTAEWRTANDIYYELEQHEAGIADTIECRPLDKRLARLSAELEQNPWFRAAFDNLPYTIELVELDKLVVSQLHVENGFAGMIAARLGPDPSPSELFRFCLPTERELPPVAIRRLGAHRYQFTSPSTDFREHAPRLLRADELVHAGGSGPVAAFFGVGVGFGANFLSGIRSGARVVLENGYHRSYALRSAGITHAWCVIEHVTRKDELRLAASETVAADPEFYFAAKRPPILRDFFDPRLAKQLMTKRMESVVEVEIKVRSGSSTAV